MYDDGLLVCLFALYKDTLRACTGSRSWHRDFVVLPSCYWHVSMAAGHPQHAQKWTVMEPGFLLCQRASDNEQFAKDIVFVGNSHERDMLPGQSLVLFLFCGNVDTMFKDKGIKACSHQNYSWIKYSTIHGFRDCETRLLRGLKASGYKHQRRSHWLLIAVVTLCTRL